MSPQLRQPHTPIPNHWEGSTPRMGPSCDDHPYCAMSCHDRALLFFVLPCSLLDWCKASGRYMSELYQYEIELNR